MFLEYGSIFLFTATKWLIGVFLILGGDRGFWMSMALCVGGGMSGVLVYTYLGRLFYTLWRKIRPSPNGKIHFTRLKRIIVRVRKKHGLAGIAFLTPILLTVPIGTFAANIIEPRKKYVIIYMFISFLIWSALLCGMEVWQKLEIFK